MSKIKIFGMGGLDENGKNTYVVEVDNKIFIFDAGLKYANDSNFGIDYIIPDYKYLIDNRKKIVGVFVTHAHSESYGGVSDLIKNIPEIKIYALKYTINQMILDGINEKNLNVLEAHHKKSFGRTLSVFPITVNHSVPDSCMYVLNTPDGSVVYTGDFIIDPSMMGAYHMDLGKIAYVGKQGVLALLGESSFSENIGHTSPSHHLSSFFKKVIYKAEGRIIFTVLPVHLYTIEGIFKAAKDSHRKVVIMGKKLQNIVNMAIRDGYMNVPDGLIGDLNNINDSNSILLVSDDRSKAYSLFDRIIAGNDKFIKFTPNDTVCFAEPKYDENEKTFVRIENELAIMGINTISLPKDRNLSLHASSEDIMIMLDLLKPKYYMPVKGEYRYMVGNANLAYDLGYNKDNILLKQNGDIVTIINGELEDKFKHINIDDTLIDGNSIDDVGDLVLKDREVLSENGIVLVTASLSKKDKKVLVGPEITTRGFIYVKDSKEMIEEIKRISLEVIENNTTDKYIDFNSIKNEIRERLGKYFYVETECKPMIIAVIQEI